MAQPSNERSGSGTGSRVEDPGSQISISISTSSLRYRPVHPTFWYTIPGTRAGPSTLRPGAREPRRTDAADVACEKRQSHAADGSVKALGIQNTNRASRLEARTERGSRLLQVRSSSCASPNEGKSYRGRSPRVPAPHQSRDQLVL